MTCLEPTSYWRASFSLSFAAHGARERRDVLAEAEADHLVVARADDEGGGGWRAGRIEDSAATPHGSRVVAPIVTAHVSAAADSPRRRKRFRAAARVAFPHGRPRRH